MKIRVTSSIIKDLNPNRGKYMLNHHKDLDMDLLEFLAYKSKYISKQSKIRVGLGLMPEFLVQVFAIDCVMHAIADGGSSSSAWRYTVTNNAGLAARTVDIPTLAEVVSFESMFAAALFDGHRGAENELDRQIDSIAYLVGTAE